jgi:hypothetical protein
MTRRALLDILQTGATRYDPKSSPSEDVHQPRTKQSALTDNCGRDRPTPLTGSTHPSTLKVEELAQRPADGPAAVRGFPLSGYGTAVLICHISFIF